MDAEHSGEGCESTEDIIPDVLADRYASPEMKAIWSPRGRILLEREFWIVVMRAQRDLGVAIPGEAIEAYERVRDNVDLARIRDRERSVRHDVKARIDEFCSLSGYEHIHKGLTSRDLTENVEQIQVLRALRVIRVKYVAALHRLGQRILEFRDLPIVGRTHNVPAQLTTVGKRLATFALEMLMGHKTLVELIEDYPARGLKGAVGTQLDLETLLGGMDRAITLEKRVSAHFGFTSILSAVGQVYPRSLDFRVLAILRALVSGPGNLARAIRLMAGAELAGEGFAVGQVGSSAMPHKVNPRSCERINGLVAVIGGYLEMGMSLAGDQWNEGDVSCSVVRRVALPGAMLGTDGLIETLLSVVRQMEAYPDAIRAEAARYLPFLATTTVLMEAVRLGVGRETAHEAIRQHAVAVARDLRLGVAAVNDLFERLAEDDRIGLTVQDLGRIAAETNDSVGAACRQAESVAETIEAIVRATPGARSYAGRDIL